MFDTRAADNDYFQLIKCLLLSDQQSETQRQEQQQSLTFNKLKPTNVWLKQLKLKKTVNF